jgi:isopentenyl-diphosphate delta-isomerase
VAKGQPSASATGNMRAGGDLRRNRPPDDDPSKPQEEQLILVDGRNRAVAPLGKREVHERGLRHRAFSIFLVDRTGRILLQRRHPSKYHSGGLWANSCCGHPRWGEGTIAAAQRRLGEELGLTAPLRLGFHTRYEARFENGLVENEAVSVLFGPCRGLLRPDPCEVAETRLIGLEKLRGDLEARPADFAFWLRHYVVHHAADLEAGLARTLQGEPGGHAASPP